VSALSVLAAAREAPDRVALLVDGVPLTFEELAARVRTCMAVVREKVAVTPESRVALVATNDPATIVLLLALLELGVTAVLVHPRLVEAERRFVIEDSCPTWTVDDPRAVVGSGSAKAANDDAPPATIDEERCLAILYTSGTSGRSKGVMLSRRAFLSAARASTANLGWRDDDRWLLCMPLAHVGGLSIVIRSLIARRTVALVTGRFDAEAIASITVRDRITILSLVPTMLARMLAPAVPDAPAPAWAPPPHVRAIFLGGAGAPAPLLERARALALPVLTTYGLTEACSQVTTQRYGTPPGLEQGAGHPVEGTSVRTVDGEIQVFGPTLMSGYFPSGAHTSPFTGDGWLRTGDLGELDGDGRLHVLSRRLDLIVTGGENVYPVEVEQALLAIDGVESACVFGVPDDTWGMTVAAVLVPKAKGTELPSAAIERALEATLAPFKRPRHIAWASELVTNAAGKIDRRATRDAATALLRPFGRAAAKATAE
jgi:O-succinylbenzoic acid--CoA ligase